MKKIKFIKPKGCCNIGYIGDYTDEEAKSLINRGFAEEFVEPIVEYKEKPFKTTKENANGSI